MKTFIRSTLRRLLSLDRDAAEVQRSLESTRRLIKQTKILQARMLIASQPATPERLTDVEFQVFSQFGDDGIIQYLVRALDLEPEYATFVEIGVENYTESNTRLLLTLNNWRGAVIEANPADAAYIRNDAIHWRHDLTVIQSFVDIGNINAILEASGFTGEIGLLSIDIDGNDWHLWKAIHAAHPIVVICEYNSVFGKERTISIPYDPGFQRMKAHHSGLYFGASLRALDCLASEKGYAFVCSNSAGNNAYFVRRDRLKGLQPVSIAEGYVASKIRESRDANGRLTFTGGSQRIGLIRGLPVLNVATGQTEIL